MQLSGADLAIIASVATTSASLTWFIAAQFSNTRKLMHELFDTMSARVTRIELHLVHRDGYQPGADPLVFDPPKRSRR